jgi:hypothetical protein
MSQSSRSAKAWSGYRCRNGSTATANQRLDIVGFLIADRERVISGSLGIRRLSQFSRQRPYNRSS